MFTRTCQVLFLKGKKLLDLSDLRIALCCLSVTAYSVYSHGPSTSRDGNKRFKDKRLLVREQFDYLAKFWFGKLVHLTWMHMTHDLGYRTIFCHGKLRLILINTAWKMLKDKADL